MRDEWMNLIKENKNDEIEELFVFLCKSLLQGNRHLISRRMASLADLMNMAKGHEGEYSDDVSEELKIWLAQTIEHI